MSAKTEGTENNYSNYSQYANNGEFKSEDLPLLMRLSENMPGGFFIYRYNRGDGELIFFNDLIVSMYGCESREEFKEYTGNTFRGMILPEDLEESMKAVNYLVDNSENRLGHIVHRIRRKDGAIRKLDEYGHLIHSDDFGEVCFVFSIDITEYGYGIPETDVDESVSQVFLGLRVLIVDDDDMSRDIESEVLESEGAVVYEARDGREALNLIQENDSFDLILMDVFMPVMDGVETTKAIRDAASKNHLEVPIISFSADEGADVQKKCFDAGADDFIRKPLSITELSMKYIACMKKRTRAMQGKVRESLLLANTDALTKVKNATAYAEKIGELNIEINQGQKIDFAVVMCDINDLKTENDKFGHDSGDRYIKNCCGIISKAFKHSPVFRIGGDEFVVFVQGEDYDNRTSLFEGMMEKVSIAEKYTTSETGRASFAAGMIDYDCKIDKTVSDTVKRADEKMYANKLASK